MADFTGFYFNNKHSSTYHLLRVSNGDRYEEELFPQFDDRTVELVGGAGNLYDSTRYKEKEFTISVVFDSLTEKDFRDIRQWLEPNKVKEFRFDERPYKAYWAKLKSPPKFEYVCFMETSDEDFNAKQERVYKGEAELNFIAYNPFGYCHDDSTKMTELGLEKIGGVNWQALDSYSHVNGIHEDNLVEWAAESGLMNKASLENFNIFKEHEHNTTDNKISYSATLYNPGDFNADFELYIKPDYQYYVESGTPQGAVPGTPRGVSITVEIIKEGNVVLDFLKFSTENLDINYCFLINSKNHSLKTILDKNTQLRYDLITEKSKNWLMIPKGESTMKITIAYLVETPATVEETNVLNTDLVRTDATENYIKYSYKYY